MHPIEFTVPPDCNPVDRGGFLRHSYKLRELIADKLPDRPGIYLLTCTTTGDTYVGGTKSLRNRVRSHLCSPAAKWFSPPVTKFIMKQGPAAFKVAVLEFCDLRDLAARERHWFDVLTPTLNEVPPSRSPSVTGWDPILHGA